MIRSNRSITSHEVAGHYDELDFYYRKLWGEHVHHGLWEVGNESPRDAVTALMELVAAGVDVSAGDRVCDVGCGYGGTSRYLAGVHQAEVVGLTISQRQYAHAVEALSCKTNPTFLLRNWEQNDLNDSSFDGLVSIECLAHVEDKAKYFQEVERVLKPGRRAAITAWLTSSHPAKWSQRHLLEPICREGRLPAMGSAEEYTKLIEATGLRVVEYRDLSPKVSKTWRICARRVGWTMMTSLEAWRFLLSGNTSHSIFMVTILRIMLAYRFREMIYGYFILEKPENNAR